MGLAVIVVGCILPLSFVAAYLIFNFYENQHDQLGKAAISRARAIITVVDRDFASTEAALLALSTSPLLAKDDLREFHAQAVEALRSMQADSIALVDSSGQLLVSTRRPFGEALPKITNPLQLQRLLEPGVSDLFVGPLSGQRIYRIAVTMKRDNSVIYSLNATVAPNQLATVLTEQKFPDSWRAVVADSSGSVVARTHEVQKFFGKKVIPDLLQRMRVADEGSYETKTLEGIPILSAYSRSPVTRWTVAIGMPLDEVTAGLRRTLAWLMVLTFSALAIGLALAWFIGGRIARSLTALTVPARALGTGAMMSIPHLHFKEANDLGQAMVEASATLNAAQFEAHHDVLTGMANRTLFHIVVNQQLSQCRLHHTVLSILYIDLDGFKKINDTHGHATGDMLLRAVSTRVKKAIRDSDIAARLGGDEFAIALIHAGIGNAVTFAEKLIEIISAPYQFGDIEAKISASIGVASYPVSATDCDVLLKKADYAMYKAKALGKHRVCAAQE
ncbi:hypothetical protein BH11PSE11_BH11PSE11_01750 [soil metagenome]